MNHPSSTSSNSGHEKTKERKGSKEGRGKKNQYTRLFFIEHFAKVENVGVRKRKMQNFKRKKEDADNDSDDNKSLKDNINNRISFLVLHIFLYVLLPLPIIRRYPFNVIPSIFVIFAIITHNNYILFFSSFNKFIYSFGNLLFLVFNTYIYYSFPSSRIILFTSMMVNIGDTSGPNPPLNRPSSISGIENDGNSGLNAYESGAGSSIMNGQDSQRKSDEVCIFLLFPKLLGYSNDDNEFPFCYLTSQ